MKKWEILTNVLRKKKVTPRDSLRELKILTIKTQSRFQSMINEVHINFLGEGEKFFEYAPS